jgi:putative membrane protein
MLPAMIATVIFGGMMAGLPDIAMQRWFHVKLLMVVGLLAYHHLLGRWRGAFAGDRNRHSARFYRMINEIPAVIMVIIVGLVVVKPF